MKINILAYQGNFGVNFQSHLYRHTFKTIYHLLDMTALVLTFIVIIYWFKIITTDDVVIQADGSSPGAALKVFDSTQMKEIYLIM